MYPSRPYPDSWNAQYERPLNGEKAERQHVGDGASVAVGHSCESQMRVALAIGALTAIHPLAEVTRPQPSSSGPGG